MPTSAPGSSRAARGFTLVELLVVLAIVALAAGAVSLAVRDPEANRLDREAVRLAVLLEAGRAESRAAGLTVAWVPARGADGAGDGPDFRFIGLPARLELPQRWLEPGTQAQVVGARELVLGPEPLIGAQRVVLARGSQRRVVATDGLEPFAVEPDGAVARGGGR